MSAPQTTFTGTFWNASALTTKTSGVAGFVYNGRQESYSVFTVQVATPSAPSTFSVQLEGSMDQVNWELIGAAVTAVGVSAQTTANVFYPFIRGNITAVTGGTNPTITMNWVASS